jgi:hypothetical protein
MSICKQSRGSYRSHESGDSRSSFGRGIRLVARRANIEALFATIRKSFIARYMQTLKALDRRAKVEAERQVVYHLCAGWSSLVARRAHNAPNANRLCRIQTT